MKPYAIVILNKYPEFAQRLLSSIALTHELIPTTLVVCDGHQTPIHRECINLHTSDPFIYARNANKGINSIVAHDRDIILCNDDLTCVEQDFFPRLAATAAKFPRCGILSPLIDGGVGNTFQRYPAGREWNNIPVDTIGIKDMPVCFPCVWISRRMIDKIGLLDENFVGYGFDDDDYCIRAREAGFLTMVTKSLRIKHGTGGAFLDRGANWSCSFSKEPARASNEEIFKKKYSASK